jgi:hypothetical protein
VDWLRADLSYTGVESSVHGSRVFARGGLPCKEDALSHALRQQIVVLPSQGSHSHAAVAASSHLIFAPLCAENLAWQITLGLADHPVKPYDDIFVGPDLRLVNSIIRSTVTMVFMQALPLFPLGIKDDRAQLMELLWQAHGRDDDSHHDHDGRDDDSHHECFLMATYHATLRGLEAFPSCCSHPPSLSYLVNKRRTVQK